MIVGKNQMASLAFEVRTVIGPSGICVFSKAIVNANANAEANTIEM
jgi:hypothetical protein